MASAGEDFDAWLSELLMKHSSEDTSIFINYITSLLNDTDASTSDKFEAILPMLQELNPDKDENDVKNLTNEIIDKWDSFNNPTSASDGSEETISNTNSSVLNKNSHKEDDPGDAIFNLIKEHKHQVVEMKKTLKSEEKEKILYQYADVSDYESSEEEEFEAKDDGLFENRNAQDVMAREKQNKEKLHENHLKQKERNKKDLAAQKERDEERKRKAKQKAAKVERRA